MQFRLSLTTLRVCVLVACWCRETLRAAIFARNVEKINAHNLKDEGWTMAINEFADLTAEEFYAARVSGYMPASRRVQRLGVPANDNLAK